jgi:hypothetical protein
MAFGQQSGPPASAKQMKYLLSLVQEAGHEGFRDARHPLGLTQRQAGGKFTSREASELIDRLVAGEFGDPTDDDDGPPSAANSGEPARRDPATIRTWGARPSGRSADARADAAAARAERRLDDQRAELLAGMPADLLVAELERRGWSCAPPPDHR